jgi:y4mF family transcriptional regulator
MEVPERELLWLQAPFEVLEFPIGNMTARSVTITSPADLGAALRDARRARGLRQEDVALAAGVGRRFIVDLESGKSTARLGEALRVASALGVRIVLEDRRG